MREREKGREREERERFFPRSKRGKISKYIKSKEQNKIEVIRIHFGTVKILHNFRNLVLVWAYG